MKKKSIKQMLKSIIRNGSPGYDKVKAEYLLLRDFGITVDNSTYPCTFRLVG